MALEACCGPAAALLHGGPADPAALGEDAYALPCGSARDVGLDQGAPVVSRGPLPAHAAALGDEPQMPVTPHRRGSGRVARHRARARRDDDVVIEAAHSYVRFRERRRPVGGDGNGEGFRTPAIQAVVWHGAGVRKPPMHEPAGARVMLWGFEGSGAPKGMAGRARSAAGWQRRTEGTVCERAIEPQ
jgi:hypothetical protein